MATTTMHELLTVALQDLREGRRVVAARLPEIAEATRDEETRAAFRRLTARSTHEMETLAEMVSKPDGEPNLWAAGILDDACRDVASTAAGPVRDVALIGAIRKFLGADIVSLETAIALVQHDDEQVSEGLRDLCERASQADHLLRQQLRQLTRQTEDQPEG